MSVMNLSSLTLLAGIWSVGVAAIPRPSASPPTPEYQPRETPRPGYFGRPVYTADRVRDNSNSPGGVAQQEPENIGFVQPIDFKHILEDVERSTKGLDLGSATNNNPLFASASGNTFQGFFNENQGFGDYTAASPSDKSYNERNEEDATGFVDPNVQFRSLFDSSQTASEGFRPEDFLNSQEDYGSAPTRGSQTRSFPSFTYSGRIEDDEPRYRSSFRQIENNDFNRPEPDFNGYQSDRRSFYEPSSNVRPTPRYAPSTQESSYRPQAASRNPKSSSPTSSNSKNNSKCKKVEKTVEYNEEDDYGFSDPEGYDPSTYNSRYKRQSRQRQGRQSSSNSRKQRPMTCYVCEDEEGRYAERCSYDSKSNPNNGEYYHSSSTSFSDNGRRPSGKSDRHRRFPSSSNKVGGNNGGGSATTIPSISLATAPLPPPLEATTAKPPEIEESEPKKVIEKRQSGARYGAAFPQTAQFQQNGQFQQNLPLRPDTRSRDGGNAAAIDFSLPRGYIGNNGGRVPGFENNVGGIAPYGNNAEATPPQYGNNEASNPPQYGNNAGGSVPDYGNNPGRVSSGPDFENNPVQQPNNNNDHSGFSFEFADSPSEQDFGFGEFGGFGTAASPRGFQFDFSIPRDYDPDVQLRLDGRRRNQPGGGGLHSSASSPGRRRESYEVDVDKEYTDYVKRFFPEAEVYGDTPLSNYPHTEPQQQQDRYSPESYEGEFEEPSYHPQYSPNNSPPQNNFRYPSTPSRDHTQPAFQFSPPPNFHNTDYSRDDDGTGHARDLNRLVQNFSGRDRLGCKKVQKGDMSCYVCKDARGMNKEECIYASNDPRNQKMAYHEVTEYSSDPPAKILPPPEHAKNLQPGSVPAASATLLHILPGNSEGDEVDDDKPISRTKTVTRVESTVYSNHVHHEDKKEKK